MIRWLFLLRRRTATQTRSLAVVPAGSRRGAGGANDGGVEAPQVVADEPLAVAAVKQEGENLVPGSVTPPGVETPISGLPGAIALGKVAPGGARVENPQDALNDGAVGVVGVSTSSPVTRIRKQQFNLLPLGVGKFIAAHGWSLSGNLPSRELGSLLL
jgi:hypothetical protein